MLPRAVLAAAEASQSQALRSLAAFVRFPSVSADPQRRADMLACAQWLASLLRRLGLRGVDIVRTPKAPLVIADHQQSPRLPSILIYGHYDVQPAGDATEWRSPPFAPVVRDGRLFGRGASDDKGQVLAHAFAAAAWLRTVGRLPINLKFLIEGGEESGSDGLRAVLTSLAQRLACNGIVVSDTTMPSPHRPALIYGLRGHITFRITASGPTRDLHSGHFAGAVANPILGLARLLASLHGADGRIAIAGFDADVIAADLAERRALQSDGPSDAELLRRSGAPALRGEPGYTPFERTTIRPALSAHGIMGGHTGPGGKSIVPSSASATIGIRLAHGQSPARIERLVRSWIARHAEPALRWTVRTEAAAPAVLFERRGRLFQAAKAAMQFGFGAAPVLLRSGGSIPIVGELHRTLSAPVALMGFGLPEDRIHSANESFSTRQFARAILTSAALLGMCRVQFASMEHPPRRPRAGRFRQTP